MRPARYTARTTLLVVGAALLAAVADGFQSRAAGGATPGSGPAPRPAPAEAADPGGVVETAVFALG